jgi:ATP-dependent RNA helicase DeaD
MSKQFSDLGISAPIIKALTELKIVVPTVQLKSNSVIVRKQNRFSRTCKNRNWKTAALDCLFTINRYQMPMYKQ